MTKKVAAVIVLVIVASLSVAGCTNPHPPSGVNNTTANKTTAKATASASSKPSATPITPTQPQKHNYHVAIIGHCVPAGCSMTDSYVYGVYQPHYAGNPRVTLSVIMKQCGPSFNAPNCTASDVNVQVTVLETGQTTYFDVNNRDNVIPFVDNILAA